MKTVLLYLGVLGTHLAFIGFYAIQQADFRASQSEAAYELEIEAPSGEALEQQLPQLPLR